MALLILALLQRIFLMSSLMLLLVWLIFFMVLIKLLPILGTISGKTVKLMVLADRKSGSAGMPRPISYAVFCLKKKTSCLRNLSWPLEVSCSYSAMLWSSPGKRAAGHGRRLSAAS